MTTTTVSVDLVSEGRSVRKQQIAFSAITLIVLGALLLIHLFFESVLGTPSFELLWLLFLGFLLKGMELVWLLDLRSRFDERIARVESGISIVATFAFAVVLVAVAHRDDSPYFVLLAIPILQCAYVFDLLFTLFTIAAADAVIIYWPWHYFHLHPPSRPTEYLQSAMICVIYAVVGILVWFLVNQLKAKQAKLSESLADLQATRELLIREEKLAAVGRLASGVAHEIRNPVAMISSALSTATNPATSMEDRREMFAIATRETERLERLTADFLTYARPSAPHRSLVHMNDLLSYIGDVSKMHAATHSIAVTAHLNCDPFAEVDSSLVEGALLNLVLNAIDATPVDGTIELTTSLKEDVLRIDIRGSGKAIPDSDLEQIFEPFFTTKPTGTGLGLAIARGIAKTHGGDVWVSSNVDGCVTFSMTLTGATAGDVREVALHG